MANKTYKAASKRFNVTKNGKVIKRKAGQDHFNTRESGKVTRNKRTDQQVVGPLKKLVLEATV